MWRFSIVIPLLLSVSVAAAAERTVMLTIDNMTCALCPITVRTAIKQVAGVKDVQVDLASKTAVVLYDDAEATVQELTEASRRAGYPAALKEVSDD